jgi:hypothetical protein
MFEENNLVETPVEPTTEETVETVEEPVKMYTEDEFNARMNELLPKKLERAKAKMRREFEEEYASYKETEAVLNAGLGTSNIEEAKDSLIEFYKQKGLDIPEYQPETVYSDEEAGVLANYEAQKIIDAGFDEVIEEVNRLADKGVEGMTNKEKRLFTQLAEYRKLEESRVELAQIGVKAEALEDAGFKEFSKKLNPNMSVREQYEMYLSTKPKSNIEPIGSMKGTKSADPTVKDFYTHEEAMKFTRADFDKNPALFEAVKRSMPKWR